MLTTDIKTPLVLRIVPETSPTHYIGGKCALNLTMPDTSGDWHQPDYIYCPQDRPIELTVFGEGVENHHNTNHIFVDYGIIESAEKLKSWGFEVNYPQVFRSDHFRAILDLLYVDLMTCDPNSRFSFITQGATEDFLDTEEQQQIIFEKALLVQPHLPADRSALVDKWIAAEKIYRAYEQ